MLGALAEYGTAGVVWTAPTLAKPLYLIGSYADEAAH
jgi:hypothetical protein